MRSPSALQSHPAASREHGVPPAAADAAVHTEAAANDNESAPGFSVYGDPLFGMAAGTIVVFALLAALMAMA